MKINIIALVSLLLSINIFCEGWHTLRTEFNIADKAAGKNLKIYKPKESGDKVDFKKDFAEIAASQWALAEITYTSSGGETIDSFPSQYANAKENVFLEIKLYYTQPVIGVEFKEKNWERWAKSFKIKNNEWNLIRIPFPPQGFALRKEGEQGNGVYNPENTSAVSVFAAAGHTLRIEYIRFVTDAEGPLSIPENKSGAEMKPEPPPIPGSAAKNFLPDPKNRKVKISGRKEQVLNAVKNQKVIWKNIAPGFMNVIIGAHLNKDVITLAIDIGGLVQTRDAGKSWQYLSYHMEGGMTSRSIFDFDISPANEKIIVIGGYKIYRTENGGLSWEEISQGLGPAAFMTKSSGFGQVKFNASGSVLYTAIGTKVWMPVGFEKTIAKNYPEKQIFISKNNAVSFITIDLKRPFAVIKCIYPHPNDNSIVYLSFGDGDFLILKDALENSREIISVAVPDGYFVRSMSIFPDDNEKMYMTLTSTSEKKSKPEVYILNNCRSAKPELEEKTIRFSGKFWNQDGIEKLPVDYGTIGFNPNRKNQVVIGSIQDNSVFISEDRGNTFAVYNLEEKFFMDDSQGAFYGNIERVYFGRNSPHAVIVSRIGAWITSDNFKTISDLTMKYEKGFYSSTGTGSPANINGLAICNKNIYWSAQDHRVFRSHGNEHSLWKFITDKKKEDTIPLQTAPWGPHTWWWKIEKLFAAKDEKYVYINALGMEKNAYEAGSFWGTKKIFQSFNKGVDWKDITVNIGKGDVYPAGSQFVKVLFDPENSDLHWILFTDALYYTDNGGSSFVQCKSDLFRDFSKKNNIFFNDMAFDKVHNILYIGAVPADSELTKKSLNQDKAPAAFYLSKDRGKTWEVNDIGQNSVKSFCVLPNGDLVIGTQKSADQPARLFTLPYGKKFDESMVKMTMGDTEYEISANQLSFWPVISDGNDVLAYANINWVLSDRFFAQGPLLSRDGGKTFSWINYDLPCNNIWSADIYGGSIVLGTVFGIYEWKYK